MSVYPSHPIFSWSHLAAAALIGPLGILWSTCPIPSHHTRGSEINKTLSVMSQFMTTTHEPLHLALLEKKKTSASLKSPGRHLDKVWVLVQYKELSQRLINDSSGERLLCFLSRMKHLCFAFPRTLEQPPLHTPCCPITDVHTGCRSPNSTRPKAEIRWVDV